jgi:hypothetical protein
VLLTSLERGERSRPQAESAAAQLFERPLRYAEAAFARIGIAL